MCQNLKHLIPVDLNEVWRNEPQDFTPWLAKEGTLTFLGNTLNMELKLEEKEKNVGDFRADILCKNIDDDSWVIIENQLNPTDHKHVGQLLTYAAGLDAFTAIWIAETFRDEHRAMLDWLNRITSEDYRFFGIEMKVWQIEGTDHGVLFEVVSSPDDWISGVNRDTQGAVNNDFPEKFERYWTGFRDYVIDNDRPIKFGVPGKQSFSVFGIGRTGFKLMAWLVRSRRRIDIRLIIDGDNAEVHFRLLEEQKEEIHNEFGETLEWNELPGFRSCRISLYKEDTDPLDENNWLQQYEWFTAKLEGLDKVFRERIKVLNAASRISESENDDE